MSLVAGVVGTVNADTGAPISGGSGWALARWNAVIKPQRLDPLATSDIKSALIAAMKDEVDAEAAALLTYVTANAAVTVTIHTTDAGLQKTPNPNNANTATLGPSSDKTLGGTVA